MLNLTKMYQVGQIVVRMNNMPDIAIGPAGLPDYKVGIRTGPVYLLTFVDKKHPFFLATKLEWLQSTVKVVGCWYSGTGCEVKEVGTEVDIATSYEELLGQKTPNQFIEMVFPLSFLLHCRNLMYRHKVQDKK
jgi:hypothetical protein